MANRHLSRQQAIQLLYNVESTNVSLEEAFYAVLDLTEDAKSFAAHVLYDLENIDRIIEENLVDYSIKRLNAVDRAIIRLAVYELLNNTPKQIVINEALELTKDFTDIGDNKAVKFNNRLLDNISKSLQK